MITRERLQELIKQGATICCIMNNSKYIADFDLSTGDFTVASDCPIIVEQEVTGHVHGYGFEQLFETKERAEWHCKMTAERTERFEPPMWEDLLEKDLYVFTFVKDREVYDFICNNYLEKVNIRLEQRLVGYSSKPVTTCQFNDATKENYIKACEIVRDLFNKGGAE